MSQGQQIFNVSDAGKSAVVNSASDTQFTKMANGRVTGQQL